MGRVVLLRIFELKSASPMTTKKQRRVANPIAVRQFRVVGEPDREVVLTIGKPRPDPDPTGDWMCSVLIEGIPGSKRQRIHGIDALQALQLAIEHARRALDASGLALTWMNHEPGDVGIPRIVPSGWGFDFQRRLESYMDEESKRIAREAIAKARQAGDDDMS